MITNEELALIWFDYNGVSFSKLEKILREFSKIDDIFNIKITKNANFAKFGAEEIKEKLLSEDFEKFKEKVEDEFYKYNITPITFVSKNYPQKLKTIDTPPIVLYTRGDVSLLSKKSISIVGTRKPSDYGKIVCDKFVKVLSGSGLVTVSGLAYGIDTCVAEATLKFGGKGIAVLGGGLHSIYPSQNKALAKRIEENGLLVSEYRPGVNPAKYSFIQRNRIVAGLGLGTLIIEAGKNSGTMSTARCAIEQGKELFVVPGNITSPQSEGTNNLIDEIPDTFTISPDRILSRLGIEKKEEKKLGAQVNLTEATILSVLAEGELDFDRLADVTGILPSELSAALIKLEMFGLVKKGNSNTYFKV